MFGETCRADGVPGRKALARRRVFAGKEGRGGQRRWLAVALAVTFLLPQSVLAAEKPADMDQETWDRLQDNVLEYDELGDRVQNFNPRR